MLPSPDALLPVAPPLCGRCRAPHHRCTACASPAHAPPLRACPCSSAHCCWHCWLALLLHFFACKQPPVPGLLCLLLEAVRACRCCRLHCRTYRHSHIVTIALTRARPPRQVLLLLNLCICKPFNNITTMFFDALPVRAWTLLAIVRIMRDTSAHVPAPSHRRAHLTLCGAPHAGARPPPPPHPRAWPRRGAVAACTGAVRVRD